MAASSAKGTRAEAATAPVATSNTDAEAAPAGAVVEKSFCSRARVCERCGRSLGFVCGINGFGIRERGHEARCIRRYGGSIGGPRDANVVQSSGKVPALLFNGELESIHWINAIVAKLWPHIDEAAQKIVHEQVAPQIREKLPSMVQSHFHFNRFTLGDVPPDLGPIEWVETPHGIRLALGINLDSTVDISIQVGASVGIQQLKFHGTLIVKLGPLLSELPVVGGVVAYFADPPTVGLDFTGLGNVVEIPGLDGIVKDTINSAIADSLVLPNVISVPLGTEEQGVDIALLSKPRPVGVLRLRAVQAKDLRGADWHLTQKATSDPYVKATLGGRTWCSSVVKETCNPKWKDDDVHDFVIFDQDQCLNVKIYDKESYLSDKLLGHVEPLTVTEALSNGASLNLNLLPEGSTPTNGSAHITCGTVEFKVEWLDLLSTDEPSEEKEEKEHIDNKEDNKDGCLVRVEIETLQLPEKLTTAAAIKVEFGSQQWVTPALSKAAPKAVSKKLQDVVKRCDENGLDRAMIAKVTELTPESIDGVLGKTSSDDVPSKDSQADLAQIQVTRVYYIPMSVSASKSESLTFSVLDKKGELIGKAGRSPLQSPSTLEFADENNKAIEDLKVDVVMTVLGLHSTGTSASAKAQASEAGATGSSTAAEATDAADSEGKKSSIMAPRKSTGSQ